MLIYVVIESNLAVQHTCYQTIAVWDSFLQQLQYNNTDAVSLGGNQEKLKYPLYCQLIDPKVQ